MAFLFVLGRRPSLLSINIYFARKFNQFGSGLHFIWLKVNFSENREVLSKYPKIKGYPHLLVLDKNGTLLRALPQVPPRLDGSLILVISLNRPAPNR